MSPRRSNVKKATKSGRAPREVVAETLAGYAKRGVFRGFSEGLDTRGKATFRVVWHRDRVFDLIFDANKNELRFLEVLTGVPAGSTMYRELKQFINARSSDELPEHRRIDGAKAHVRVSNRGGIVAVALAASGGDYEYGVRKLVHLVHEIFMVFLIEGRYLDYMVEAFDLDPDKM
jgi:hypothetical protein